MHAFLSGCLHCNFMICSTNMIKSSTISKNKKFYNYTVTQYKMEKKNLFHKYPKSVANIYACNDINPSSINLVSILAMYTCIVCTHRLLAINL